MFKKTGFACFGSPSNQSLKAFGDFSGKQIKIEPLKPGAMRKTEGHTSSLESLDGKNRFYIPEFALYKYLIVLTLVSLLYPDFLSRSKIVALRPK